MNVEILEIIDNIKDQAKNFGEFSEPDITKISKKASATFFGTLSEDEIEISEEASGNEDDDGFFNKSMIKKKGMTS